MLSRYFSFTPSAKLASLSIVVVIGLLPVANANSNVLLDSTGKPLPSDFGALLEQLGQSSDSNKRKILGLDPAPAAVSAPPSVQTLPTPSPSTKAPEAAADEESVVAEEEKPVEKPKNPAFYNPELARRLYNALDVGDAARTKWLLKSGAGNVYVTDTKDTSLRLAIRKRWASVVRVLLERDPDLEQKLPGNVNLLHDASVQGAYDIAKMLIEAGLDPEEKTAKNWTNLHLAARYGHVDMVRYYLSLGLDPDARNSEGNTAHWLASHLKHYQVAGYLSSRTNVTSHQIFDNGKSKSSKKSKRKKKSISQAFSPAQLEALKNL
ncbi:hypothetical protein DKW60_18450 [Leucothrix pacifica]|uniref:Uncharacterized protein n=1 Tax=Leucothrix pacifica TaxID=1247513 RepID=A0A317C340_9GAMM|nr:hypothetical protein DKW60_18450 [Leucothrix pacifica]